MVDSRGENEQVAGQDVSMIGSRCAYVGGANGVRATHLVLRSVGIDVSLYALNPMYAAGGLLASAFYLRRHVEWVASRYGH